MSTGESTAFSSPAPERNCAVSASKQPYGDEMPSGSRSCPSYAASAITSAEPPGRSSAAAMTTTSTAATALIYQALRGLLRFAPALSTSSSEMFVTAS